MKFDKTSELYGKMINNEQTRLVKCHAVLLLRLAAAAIAP